MTEAHAAVGLDRLPWLSDEPTRRAKDDPRDLIGWALAAAVLVAGVSYWMGFNSLRPPAAFPETHETRPATTVALPEARPAEPAMPIVEPAPQREVEPVAAPFVPVARAVPQRAPVKHVRSRTVHKPIAKPMKAQAKSKRRASNAYRPWPARVVEGAAGRLVRIGVFTSSRQAKKGWWAIMRINPALRRLPAVVIPVRSLRNGRTYYRLQMGTTSHAHSEVLCQRMRMIGQSCVVIGLNPASMS